MLNVKLLSPPPNLESLIVVLFYTKSFQKPLLQTGQENHNSLLEGIKWLVLTNMPYLFRNIIPNIWNVPHSKKGIKAWALFRFLDIRFIWESVVMSDSSKEHLNTDNKVLQQQHQHHHQPHWILNLVLQAKSTVSLFKNTWVSTAVFSLTRLYSYFHFPK